jgi:hypothetical protein
MMTITVIGGNLFKIAAIYLNDATQWVRIAQANGLSDPIVYGMTVLVIPPADPMAVGGIIG